MKGMFVLSLLSLIAILFLIFDRRGWVLNPVKGIEDVFSRIGIGLLCAVLCALSFALSFAQVHP